MRYTKHLSSMTIAVHTPFFARSKRRAALITPQQYRLVARVMGGWHGSQRDLAVQTGYTIGGLNDALRALRATGVLAVATLRGCRGSTRLRLQRGVHVTANVRERSDDRSQTSRNDVETSSSLANIAMRLVSDLRRLVAPAALAADSAACAATSAGAAS